MSQIVNNPHDRDAANEKKWSQRAVTFDDKRHDYFRFFQRLLIASAGINPPTNFLDLGCGTGWAVGYVARMSGFKGRSVGIDISKGMIEKARQNTLSLPNVEFYEASANKLPLEDASFNTAICSNSFHHYSQPEEALMEVRRVLKLNGRIHILDVTADDFFIRRIDKWVRMREMEHIKFYGTAEYTHMFAQAGLRHIRSYRLKMFYPLKVHIGEKDS